MSRWQVAVVVICCGFAQRPSEVVCKACNKVVDENHIQTGAALPGGQGASMAPEVLSIGGPSV